MSQDTHFPLSIAAKRGPKTHLKRTNFSIAAKIKFIANQLQGQFIQLYKGNIQIYKKITIRLVQYFHFRIAGLYKHKSISSIICQL